MQPEAPDSHELDALLDLERSEGWALVRQRMEAELEDLRLQLETPGEHDYKRGRVREARVMLEIPAILKGEIAGQLKSK
jgi:hypothetical protein